MIQRIQSVFLLIAAVCYVCTCFLPIATLTTSDAYYLFDSWAVRENIPEGAVVCNTFYIGLFQLVMAVFSLVIIFVYKNRNLQSRLCLIDIFLGFILIALMLFVYPDMILSKISTIRGFDLVYSMKTIISMLPILWIYLANKFILKDEKKVRDADRVR